ncbi:MAG: Ran-binding zinc finger domain-containing protein [Planctomycetota bacterium]
MAIREGKWKCPSCSTVNRGAETQCGQCGTTRDANVKFFLDENAEEVTEASQLAKAKAGADWLCEFCGNSSSQTSPTCTGCGAPKSEKQKKHGDVIPIGGAALAAQPVAQPVAPPPPPQKSSGLGPVAIAVLALMMLMCCVCGWWQFRTKAGTATVAAAQWQRSIDVEDFLPTKESCWDHEPQGAYDVSHRREQDGTRKETHGTRTEEYTEQVKTGTRKVKTGHKDLGNGHFEDVYKDEPIYENRRATRQVPNVVEVPVYREKYYYTIDKWRVVRTDRAKGGATDPPAWPPVALKGKEREGPRRELYLVGFTSNEAGPKTLRMEPGVWAQFRPGSAWPVAFSNAGKYEILDAKDAPMAGIAVAEQGQAIQ